MRKRLKSLLSVVTKEEKVAKKRREEARYAANQTAKTAINSWSAAGERVISEGQAMVLEEYYFKLLDFKKKLEEAAKESIPESIEEYCYIKILLDGKEDEFYLVDNPLNISHVKLVSKGSALGKSLLGKRMGDEFSFSLGEG